MPKPAFFTAEAIQFGWETVKKNLGFFIVLMLVVFAIRPGASFGPFFNPSMPWQDNTTSTAISNLNNPEITTVVSLLVLFTILIVIIGFIAWVFQVLVNISLNKIALTFADNKKISFDEVFKSYNVFLNYIIGNFLFGVIVFLGFMFFIVPGVIFALRLQFVPYLIIDKNLDAVSAVKHSWEMTRSHTLDLLGFLAVSILINFLGVLFLFVGLLVTIPTTMVAHAHVYRKLEHHNASKS